LLPHIPQLLGSVSRIASHPLTASASQFAKPALHWPTLHAPAWHWPMALGAVQIVSHAPQLLLSVAVLVSQPFAEFPSQSLNPVAHVSNAQPCAVHFAMAFAMAHGSHPTPQPN
jgi:hypothetical protein